MGGIRTPAARPGRLDWIALGAAGLLLAAIAAAYANSFSGPFVFDDGPSIAGNPTIRRLWPIGRALSPPAGGLAVSGRPLVNLSLAVNYGLSGLRVWSYHALNLCVHFLAAAVLFGIVRRTLRRTIAAGEALTAALLAFAVALIWAVHPLQTESVTYVIQRAESLMGLCYLLTLYAFIRGWEAGADRGARQRWYLCSVLSCLAGMATKEVMVTAPLMVLAYDRVFLAESLKQALRQRWRLYAGLAGTWLLLALLIAGTGDRGGTVATGGPALWRAYALSQFSAVAHYLRLAIWPRPLVIDYGFAPEPLGREGLMSAIAVVVLLGAATVLALWRRPKLGFLGLWFFLILAPTSSIVPIVTEPMAEHRMYLPLAAIVALAVLAIYGAAARLCRGRSPTGVGAALACLAVCVVPAAALGGMTAERNEDYRSPLALWSDTVRSLPGNAGARNNLGDALLQQGRIQDALVQYREAVRLSPGFAGARLNLANALLKTGQPREALAESAEAVRLSPDSVRTRETFAHALAETGRLSEAIAQYEQALRLDPRAAEAHRSLGSVLLRSNRVPDAIAEYRAALRLAPEDAESHAYLGFALAKSARVAEAIAEYDEALRIAPGLIDARVNLGSILLAGGQLRPALAQFQAAVRFGPDNAQAHQDLALTLLALGRADEARAEFQIVGRLAGSH